MVVVPTLKSSTGISSNEKNRRSKVSEFLLNCPYVETEPLSITFLTLFKTQDTIPMY